MLLTSRTVTCENKIGPLEEHLKGNRQARIFFKILFQKTDLLKIVQLSGASGMTLLEHYIHDRGAETDLEIFTGLMKGMNLQGKFSVEAILWKICWMFSEYLGRIRSVIPLTL